MNIQTLQAFAGFTSTAMFVMGNLPMLLKAHKTKDLRSYSPGHIVLGTLGNLIYWLYIASLPFGPVWILQGFFTLSSVLMLLWYLRYEKGWDLYSKAGIQKVEQPYGQRFESATANASR